MSDAVGAVGRPFTIALPWRKGWIVVLNLGPTGFNDPVHSDKAALVHQLAHAWRSQHHPEPWEFMVNIYHNQRQAAEATVLSAINRLYRARGLVKYLTQDPNFSEASTYAWVPKRHFGDFGAEQIAQQVQDFCFPPSGAAPRTSGAILWHMRTVPPGKPDPDNIHSLHWLPGWAYRDAPNVVWHPP